MIQDTNWWRAGNLTMWIAGTAMLAAHIVAALMYGPRALADREAVLREQVAWEHKLACEALEPTATDAHQHCLMLLVQLQHRHEAAYVAAHTRH
jgi:hypothetical protein